MSEQGSGTDHPEPEPGAVSASQADALGIEPAEPATEPTPVVGAADATADRPAGTARPLHAAPTPIGEERPEILAGAAFGGGLVAALLLKGLARRKHR